MTHPSFYALHPLEEGRLGQAAVKGGGCAHLAGKEGERFDDSIAPPAIPVRSTPAVRRALSWHRSTSSCRSPSRSHAHRSSAAAPSRTVAGRARRTTAAEQLARTSRRIVRVIGPATSSPVRTPVTAAAISISELGRAQERSGVRIGWLGMAMLLRGPSQSAQAVERREVAGVDEH